MKHYENATEFHLQFSKTSIRFVNGALQIMGYDFLTAVSIFFYCPSFVHNSSDLLQLNLQTLRMQNRTR